MLFEIEKFHKNSDGNDWLPAVMRAQNELTSGQLGLKFRGITLFFGRNEYSFLDSIHLVRGMSLVGSGGAGWYAGSILRFPKGKHGIICEHAIPSSNPANEIPGGDWSIIERLHIEGGGGTPSDSPVAHGVIMNARMTIRDCYITQFSGDGIHSEATGPKTNANVWQIQNCRVDGCENGLFLDPADTNAGCAITLDCSSNRGWGIHDNSFIGNTYIACHTADNKKGSYWCARPPEHRTTLSLFLNCYAEQDQPKAQIEAPGIVLGGVMDVQGSAIWMSPDDFKASFHNGIRAFGVNQEGKPLVAGYLGSQVLSAALELHVSNRSNYAADAIPYRLIYERSKEGWWELNFANGDGLTPIRFSTNKAEEGAGQLWFENGFYIGFITTRIKQMSGALTKNADGTWTPPALPGVGYHKGDRFLNPFPSPGDFAGWICVEESTPQNSGGIWKGFGLIET